ncbi:DUF4440 domain-containing protein [Candidatus Marinamargulisbacteria bacterium SCGC AG-414-C22]|nr:DUF4440 domain-containing protein [Candidatus Marinamargulisbacteria bacterium SCGC AG-414-C22]
MTHKDISELFNQWNKALGTQDRHKVLALYAPYSILLPTLSNTVCDSPEKKINYFKKFCAKGPVDVINISHIRLYGKVAIHSGIYTFTFEDGSAATARFTFVYQNDLIVEHHSSLLPEE